MTLHIRSGECKGIDAMDQCGQTLMHSLDRADRCDDRLDMKFILPSLPDIQQTSTSPPFKLNHDL